MELRNKTAIVTGGGSGIGRAVCLAMAERGAHIVAADVDEQGALETVRLVEEAGARGHAIACDVTDPIAFEALFRQTAERFAGVDILINNAGIVTPPPGWPEVDAGSLARVIQTDLSSVFIGLRTALDFFGPRGGVVINVSSGAALIPLPFDPAYGAAKAGIVYLTRASAPLLESHRVRVAAALPGMTDTPMHDKTGGGKPAAWLQPILDAGGSQPVGEVAQTVIDLIEDDTLVSVCRGCRPASQGGDRDIPFVPPSAD